jgi:hypothetical protein
LLEQAVGELRAATRSTADYRSANERSHTSTTSMGTRGGSTVTRTPCRCYIDVWENKEDLDRFTDERLHPVVGPVLRRGVADLGTCNRRPGCTPWRRSSGSSSASSSGTVKSHSSAVLMIERIAAGPSCGGLSNGL